MSSHKDLVEKASRHAHSLQVEEIHDIAKAWKSFDVNGDETVKVSEVNQVLSHLNVNISDEKKKQFETDLDKNGDGTISFVEFVMFYEKGKYKDYL